MRSDLVAAIFLIVAAIVTVRYWEMRAPENHGQTQQEFSDEAAASKHSIYKRSVKIRIGQNQQYFTCLLYTSPSPRDQRGSRMPSSA